VVKVSTLLAASAVVLSACVAPAGAEGQLGSDGTDEVSPSTSPLQSEASVVLVSGPVRYVDSDGSYQIRVEWTQQIRHPDLDIEIDATVNLMVRPLQGEALASRLLELHPDSDGADVGQDRLNFSVTGDVRYDVSDAACHARGVGQVCELASVTDAAVQGSATLQESELTMSIEWAKFGQERVEARPRFRVASWAESESKAPSLTTIELEDLSEALEAAGLIGRSFAIDIDRFSPRTFRGSSSFGSGQGLLELVAR